jgi:hypothetical protein
MNRIEVERTNLMFLPVVVGQLLTRLAELLLHQRVHYDLLADRVAGDFPPELVRELGGCVEIASLACLLV